MANNTQYTREQLLDVIHSYLRQIERNGNEYPTVVLDDIAKSIQFVLDKNNYTYGKEV